MYSSDHFELLQICANNMRIAEQCCNNKIAFSNVLFYSTLTPCSFAYYIIIAIIMIHIIKIIIIVSGRAEIHIEYIQKATQAQYYLSRQWDETTM